MNNWKGSYTLGLNPPRMQYRPQTRREITQSRRTRRRNDCTECRIIRIIAISNIIFASTIGAGSIVIAISVLV